MSKVYILRGLPGSGKSTFVKTLHDAVVCSADNYFMKYGKYNYDPSKIGEAHNECLRLFLHYLMFEGSKIIVVDNTNTTDVELAPYVSICNAFNIEYSIIEFPCDVETSVVRNIHNVPRKTIEQMDRRLKKPLPPWWNITQQNN